MEKGTTNKRQDYILKLLEGGVGLSIAEIIRELQKGFGQVTKITVNRDLVYLTRAGLIESHGKARATRYKISIHYNLIRNIDVEDYFKNGPDKRRIQESFNFSIFDLLEDIFSDHEQKYLEDLNQEFHNNVRRLSPTILKKELERLIIEFSWKSSQIEGNTYTLLETEALILRQKEAEGHNKKEATMILNHKKALDFILNNKKDFQDITAGKIEYIHSLIVDGLQVPKNIRKSLVGITGTRYRPLDNQWQIKEALEDLCKLVNGEENIFAKSMILSLMIAYIQPFEDGNKRTARMLGNAILLAWGSCPLSYRSASEEEYKKAVLLFYEINNLNYYKRLFINQFEFAVKNYFLS